MMMSSFRSLPQKDNLIITLLQIYVQLSDNVSIIVKCYPAVHGTIKLLLKVLDMEEIKDEAGLYWCFL